MNQLTRSYYEDRIIDLIDKAGEMTQSDIQGAAQGIVLGIIHTMNDKKYK